MQVTLILWSSAILVTAAITRGSILPALMSAIPSGSKVTFLFLSSSAPSAESVPPWPSWPNCEGSTAWCLAPPPVGWSARSAALVPDEAGCGSTGAAATGAAAGAAGAGACAPAGCGSPTSTAAFGTLWSFGRSVALGRSFASSLIAATFFCASSAALVSGDSCWVISPAAASAADFGFATAGSAAAAGPAPLASAAAAGSPAAAGASPAPTGSAAAAGGGGRAAGAGRAAVPARARAADRVGPVAPAGAGRGRGGRGGWRRQAAAEVADSREVDAAQDVADRLRDVVEMRGDVLGELHDADALHRRRHHHAGEARLGLPHVQRHHRLARAELHLLCELLQPRLPARLGRVAAEARAERRVDEQALDQLRGDVSFRGGHRSPPQARAAFGPRTRSTSGRPRTTKTGMKRATHSVPSTAQTT